MNFAPSASDSDIERWLARANRSLEILERRLDCLDSPKADAQGLSLLSNTYVSRGYAHIARSDYVAARNSLCKAVNATNALYDLIASGNREAQGYDRSGNFQTLLAAHATGDLNVVSSFSRRFSISSTASSAGPDDSTYLASACITLTRGTIDDAARGLAHERPEIDRLFAGYDLCLAAIAQQDSIAFVNNLSDAAAAWHKYSLANFQGLPRSVCFLDGVGLLHLARTVLSDPTLDPGSPYIPIALLKP